MAVDVQRNLIGVRRPRKWWSHVFPVKDVPLVYRGYIQQALTVGQLYQLASSSVPDGSTVVLMTAEGGTVRWMLGDQPTATLGMPLAAGGSIELTLANIDLLQFTAGTPGAIVNLMFFGQYGP